MHIKRMHIVISGLIIFSITILSFILIISIGFHGNNLFIQNYAKYALQNISKRNTVGENKSMPSMNFYHYNSNINKVGIPLLNLIQNRSLA